MRSAVVCATARTAIGKAFKGALNATHGAIIAGHVVAEVISRSGDDPASIDDVIMGCGLPEGATGQNIARLAAMQARLPASVPGLTVNRFCSSGLQAIAIGARAIGAGDLDVVVAGGVESISLVQPVLNQHHLREPGLLAFKPALWMSMLETAETVSARYCVPRERQDAYAVSSQIRTEAARRAGKFATEIAPITVTKHVIDRDTKEVTAIEVELAIDEGPRPGTSVADLANLAPAIGPFGTVTAGNATQLSDGAAAVLLCEQGRAERLGLPIFGRFAGMAVAGCEPDEMGIGPVLAVPKLLTRQGLSVADVDLWELNEAFAVQVLYCQQRLGIPDDRLNVNGGAIALGHPYGMSGARRGETTRGSSRRRYDVRRRRNGRGRLV